MELGRPKSSKPYSFAYFSPSARIHKLIAAGESRTVEFKKAGLALNRDLYETICAFLNRDGGDIFLGVKDDGTIQGVDPASVSRMKRDFANTINNPQKINPPCYLSMDEIEHEGRMLLHIMAPPSSQVHRCNGRIYDRNEDGDCDITDNQTLVTQLYVRKQSHYSENNIYAYADMQDLRPDLIDHARKLAGLRLPGHPWTSMDDRELLGSAQLWRRVLSPIA
jgi:ATP-dependent DNA helicase RecG